MSQQKIVIAHSRCTNCNAEKKVRLNTNEVPRQGSRFRFQCDECETNMLGVVDAVSFLDASAKYDVEGILLDEETLLEE